MPFMALLVCFCLSSCCQGADDDFLPNDGIQDEDNSDSNQADSEGNETYTYSFVTSATQDLLDFYDTDVTITMADGTVTAKRLSTPNEAISFTSGTHQDFNVVYKSVLKNDAASRIDDARTYSFPLSAYTINVVDSKGNVVYSYSGGTGGRSVSGSRLRNNLDYFAQSYELKYNKDTAEPEQHSYNNVEYVDKDANTLTITEGETFVDLGLSVKWASKNLAMEDYTLYGSSYFAWGELKPKNGNYTWNNYALFNTGSKAISKYNATDGLTRLNEYDDAAFYNRYFYEGNDFCRMPTAEEAQELIKNCTWTWGVYNGEYGYKVEGKGNSIFLPAAGAMGADAQHYMEQYGQPRGRGSIGSYWTSDLKENKTYPYQVAYCLCFENSNVKTEITISDANQPRYAGCTIRAVCTR